MSKKVIEESKSSNLASDHSFEKLGLSKALLRAVKQQGYNTPSPIQAQAIPVVLKGDDLLAAAQTGTGKTAGFTLPIIERLIKGQSAAANQARALILCPTRELAAQVHDNVKEYSQYTKLRSGVVFGGVKINPQMMMLRKGADILVATPGRLLDLYQQNAVRFNNLDVLVLDEADRMLDMGFIHDIKKIMAVLPKRRQTLLFSATFSNDIRSLAKSFLSSPKEVSVSPRNATATTVHHCIHPVDKKRKSALLIHLVKTKSWYQVLVFSRTKHGANKLTRQLEDAGIKAAAIHGNKSQGARTRALKEFKAQEIQILVATDIAARGIDIDQLPHVVNFDLPNISEDYVHRIGRTGRAGSEGNAVSLVSADEFEYLCGIERLLKKLLTREEIEGFEPTHDLPESKLNMRPFKINTNTSAKAHPRRQERGRSNGSQKARSGRPGRAPTTSSTR